MTTTTRTDFAPGMADAEAAAQAPVSMPLRDEVDARVTDVRAVVHLAEAHLEANFEIP